MLAWTLQVGQRVGSLSGTDSRKDRVRDVSHRDAPSLTCSGPKLMHRPRLCKESLGRFQSPGSAGHLPETDTHSSRC